MRVSGKTAHRVVSIALYTALVLATVFAGSKGINFAIDAKFHQDFLIGWELSIQKFTADSGTWPNFSGGNHVVYMDGLLQEMRKRGITPPSSNTDRTYIYRIQKIALNSPEAQLFLLCFPDKIIVYDMPEATFKRIEALVDENPDPDKGLFSGRLGKNDTYTGLWRVH
jgi:hypothetical protein